MHVCAAFKQYIVYMQVKVYAIYYAEISYNTGNYNFVNDYEVAITIIIYTYNTPNMSFNTCGGSDLSLSTVTVYFLIYVKSF